MLIYTPIEILLNRLDPAERLQSFLVGLAWLVVLFAIFTRAWRAGLRRFSAVGA
jgi:ABC-type uncharacterized transport system permease subunit